MSLTESKTSNISTAWDRYAVAYQNGARLSTDSVSYGPGLGNEADYRLLGPVAGKRVLDLGCGAGQAAIALAKQGAIAIGVDISLEQLAYARRLLEEEEGVRVELKHGNLAELAFLQADSTDAVLGVYAFHYVPDLNRVFRQVHRVLKANGLLVFSLPHPFLAMTGITSTTRSGSLVQLSLESEPVVINRSYFNESPMEVDYKGVTFTEYHRSISEIFMGLVRTGYRVDTFLEPTVGAGPIPEGLIVRARKV